MFRSHMKGKHLAVLFKGYKGSIKKTAGCMIFSIILMQHIVAQ
jgi:hypothetical protein